MNQKLNSIKPYIKFFLQHMMMRPVGDDAIDTLCNKGKMVSVADVGEGYILVSETRLTTRKEFEGGGKE